MSIHVGSSHRSCFTLSHLTLNSLHRTYLVVDGTAAVLEDDLADGVGGGEEGVVGKAVGGENPVEVGHQG